MFVTKNQIFVFIACVTFGLFSGLLFGALSFIKVFIKYKIVKAILDVFCGAILGVAFVLYTYKLSFPSLRVYMFIGVLLGLVCYFKSFNILLAKSAEKIYNIYKQKKVKKLNDRIKIQKAGRRCNRRRGNTSNNTDIGNGLSVGIDKC